MKNHKLYFSRRLNSWDSIKVSTWPKHVQCQLEHFKRPAAVKNLTIVTCI